VQRADPSARELMGIHAGYVVNPKCGSILSGRTAIMGFSKPGPEVDDLETLGVPSPGVAAMLAIEPRTVATVENEGGHVICIGSIPALEGSNAR